MIGNDVCSAAVHLRKDSVVIMSAPRKVRRSNVVTIMIIVAIVILVVTVGIVLMNKKNTSTLLGRSFEQTSFDSPAVSSTATPVAQGAEAATAVTETKSPKFISPPVSANDKRDANSVLASDSRSHFRNQKASLLPKKFDLANDEVSSRKAFRRDAEIIYKRLPTMGSFRGLKGEDAHQTPLAVQEAGAQLGHLAEMLVNDPRLAHDGFRFYEQCFKRADLIPQIRALCLADFRKWKKRSPADSLLPENLVGIPAQVVDLAGQIPIEE